jgi:hypothetical protein
MVIEIVGLQVIRRHGQRWCVGVCPGAFRVFGEASMGEGGETCGVVLYLRTTILVVHLCFLCRRGGQHPSWAYPLGSHQVSTSHVGTRRPKTKDEDRTLLSFSSGVSSEGSLRLSVALEGQLRGTLLTRECIFGLFCADHFHFLNLRRFPETP